MKVFILTLCLLLITSGCDSRNTASSDIEVQRAARKWIDWFNESDGRDGPKPPSITSTTIGSLRSTEFAVLDDGIQIGQSRLMMGAADIKKHHAKLDALISGSDWQIAEPTILLLDDLLAAVMIEAGKRRNERVYVNAALWRSALIDIEAKARGGMTPDLENKKELLVLLGKNASLRGKYHIDKIP